MTPVLENVIATEELGAVARRKKKTYLQKTIHPEQLPEAIAEGWQQAGRRRKTSVRVTRAKSHDVLLPDRVWNCMHQMGFRYMSGDRGAWLVHEPADAKGPRTQIDVLAIDDEVAIAIECKSAEEPRKDPRFEEELGKHVLVREILSRAVQNQFPTEKKRKIILAMATHNLLLTGPDQARADEHHVILVDESDLDYYQALVHQLGTAARYQILCDMVPGRAIPGLEVTVPALKSRMGSYDCYTFMAAPEYLLKICYVAHRAKGKASDVDTYQRMVSRGRLARIRQYILENGIFPTNIVLSIQDPGLVQFDRAKQEGTDGGATYGWLHLSPTYKSAWVIDGQHRLFAYSGLDRASRSQLPVLAFVGLPASEQAELFIDINGEQRRVKKNLLQELFAELRWNSSNPLDRIAAITSKAIQQMDEDPDSPFFGRILKADESRNPQRCISLTNVFHALDRNGIHYSRVKHGQVVEFGPLWATETDPTLKRTKTVLNGWFGLVRSGAQSWWDIGSGEGGGLAMNDGVTICISVLRSVLGDIESTGSKLIENTDQEVVDRIRPYGEALGSYLGRMTPEQREQFRSLRGGQGQTRGSFEAQIAIRAQMPTFNPPELDEFVSRQSAQTTQKANQLILQIEAALQKAVLEELKEEFDGERWWYDGVPKSVRVKVTQKIEEDKGLRGGWGQNLDLVDYRDIIHSNWELFRELLGRGDSGGKDKRTEWIARVNEVRKSAMHASRGTGVSFAELEEIERYARWLNLQLSKPAG